MGLTEGGAHRLAWVRSAAVQKLEARYGVSLTGSDGDVGSVVPLTQGY
jgi:hypothetical protein